MSRKTWQETHVPADGKCGKCGTSNLFFVDGADCDGLPGIIYKMCNNCGWTTATKRTKLPRRDG